MSDSNVGGRRKRNIRDNLFVLYAIINDAIRNKISIDVQFYDISKCFDAMWAEETMNDFYDAGVRDDRFSLISLMNEQCKVKVKTPVGDTERFELNARDSTCPIKVCRADGYTRQAILHLQYWAVSV